MNGTTTMSSITPRQFIVAIGILLATIGFLALLMPVSADYTDSFLGYETADCGTTVHPSAQLFGDRACREAISDRRTWALPLGLIGLVVVIGGVMVRSEQQQQTLRDEDPAS